MSSITTIKLNISEKLEKDKIYRKKFFRRRTHNEIAMSFKGLREKRQMRQVDLANESNMKQSAISRIEQSEYSAWTLTTLFRVAEALDARVRVIIDPIEDVIKQYREKELAQEADRHFTTVHVSSALENGINASNITTPSITQNHPSLAGTNVAIGTN